jgi:hypothetical protein
MLIEICIIKYYNVLYYMSDSLVEVDMDVNTSAVQIVTPAKPSNQDCKQKISIIPTIAFELYRVLISSFLILFVPQKCDDHVCQLHENLVFENAKYGAGVVLKFITIAGLRGFYFN